MQKIATISPDRKSHCHKEKIMQGPTFTIDRPLEGAKPAYPRFAHGKDTGSLWCQTGALADWICILGRGGAISGERTKLISLGEILPPNTKITIIT
jgi:hypothetical protein